MLQSLIAERFHLKFHRETKAMPVYSLVQTKSGLAGAPDIKRSPSGDCAKITSHDAAPVVHAGSGTPPTPCGGESVNAGKIVGHRSNMDELSTNLAIMVERSVINRTGLNGSFDFTLTWTPDSMPDGIGPSIYAALQEQLGLKLAAGRGQVEMLVVDSAEKLSEN